MFIFWNFSCKWIIVLEDEIKTYIHPLLGYLYYQILRRLIRVLRVGLCARAGACEGGPRRHPPSLKSPNAKLELSDAIFARIFGVISLFQLF